MWTTSRRRVLLVATIAVAAAACAGDASPRRGGTVVIAAGNDIDFANPLVSADALTNEILRYALFLPLVQYGPDLEFEPMLAESWEMIGDTAVVFRLRRDVAWHDGVPTTAHDVLFTFERARDPATGFTNADYFSHWTAGEVVDSFTIRFRLEPHAEPLAGWPFAPVVPRHVLDTVPAAAMRQAAFNRQPVGNGPFRFVSRRANDRWIFEANPDFPAALGGPPLIDRLVLRVIPDNTAQVTEIRVGSVDLALRPSPDQVAEAAARPEIHAVVKPSRQFSFLVWNAQRPPLDDPRVRRALAMAIDRDRMLDGLRRGYGSPGVGPIMPFHWSWDDGIRPVAFDPDAARALLEEAGIRDRSGDGRLQLEDGSAFRLEIKFPAGSDAWRDLSEAVRGDLARLGVAVTLRPLEATTLFGDLMSAERRFEAALLGWSGDVRVDLRDTFHSRAASGPYQFASYRNPEVDALLDRAVVELDREAAAPIWRRVQRILRDEQPWTVLFYHTDAFLVRDRLNGLEMDIRGALVSLPRWWVDDPGAHDDALDGDRTEEDHDG
jgi:peptide/nickel transport system substrate-binding protein